MNREEKFVGAVVAACLWYFTGWYSILTIPMCARLWSMGGSDQYDKNWRRICIPILLCGCLTLNLKSYLPLISLIPFYGVLTCGYGIPCHGDSGSPIGRFWYYKCSQSDVKATIMTRATLCLLLGISTIPLAFINLGIWYISVCMMMILVPTIVTCVD